MFRAGVVAFGLAAGAPAAAAEPVQVMVIGTYHFANPNMDIHNIKADTPLTPQRQAELARIADSVATFRPTRVMVEQVSDAPGLDLADYSGFGPAVLAKDPDETVQLGFRIARVSGLRSVQGVDEQPGEGEPDYFPFDKLPAAAAKFGQQAQVSASSDALKPFLSEFEAAQKTSSIAQLLTRMNDPGTPISDLRSYYGVLSIGDTADQAGAYLNAMWYMRNAKIFAKLMQVARPGDRIVLVFGAGHGYWLRHFATETPGYVSVDPRPFLARADN